MVDAKALKKMKQEAAPKPSNDDLGELTDLVEKVRAKENDLAEVEQLVKDTKKEIEGLITKDIPDLMADKGIKEVKLADGTQVSIDRKLFASVRKADQDEAFEWLKEHGFGDIAKEEIKISFTKGELKRLVDVKNFIHNNGYDDSAKFSSSINSNSLSALIRSEVKSGNHVFLDTEVKKLLGVYDRVEAKIKTPKR